MYIDPLTNSRDMYYSQEEEYQDWCSEYGLDPDSPEAQDAWADAPLGRFGEKLAPSPSITTTHPERTQQ